MSVEIVDVFCPVKQPLSLEKFREYLKNNGWLQENCHLYEKWRHSSGKSPLLNLSENHLQLSLNSVAEYENRINFAVWQDIMQPERDWSENND